MNIFFQITVLEGKYWKRQMEAVSAEYKKWRLYHKSSLFGGDASNILDQDLVSFKQHVFIRGLD